MKAALGAAFGVVVVLAAAAALVAWQPWGGKEREAELDWLEALSAWSDRIDRGLAGGDLYPAANCADAYAREVAAPPDSLAAADRLARRACERLSAWVESDEEDPEPGWASLRHALVAELTERRRQGSRPRHSSELARHATPLAGARPWVFCWGEGEWVELNEDWSRIESDEFWLAGFADPDDRTIDLAPDVCEPLDRFFATSYAPSLNEESLHLAYALVVLAHEAEHLRSPGASEAAVECVAIQRVRDLVRAAGRGKPYQELMAGLAWDVGYPDLPEQYRTAECRDGSRLDVRPETTVFP